MEQFVFQLLTRSQRITYDNLQLRDPELMDRIRHWFHGSRPEAHRPPSVDTPPMFYPFTLRDLRLANRVVVSPMAQYSAVDGIPDEWHLVHLGSRAVGGAGLVMTEMTCVSPEGRITPGCTGLWDDAQQEAWAPIVDFVHRHTPARIGLQLGHAGRKGSCKVPWEGDGDDEPLDTGNWPLLAPSAVAWAPRNQVPAAMDRAAMDLVRDQHVAAAERGADLGFDLLELHFAHGYLMSSFLSPLCNRRDDEYGGPVGNRLRYPLEVVRAVRAVWPDHLPLSVRFSATDWMAGGNDGDDAVAIAAAMAGAGVDVIDVSTGQVHADQQPRVRAAVPDAVQRPDPPGGGHPDDDRGCGVERGRRQHHRAVRPGRPVPAGALAPGRPLLDAQRRHRPGFRRAPVAGAVPLREDRPKA